MALDCSTHWGEAPPPDGGVRPLSGLVTIQDPQPPENPASRRTATYGAYEELGLPARTAALPAFDEADGGKEDTVGADCECAASAEIAPVATAANSEPPAAMTAATSDTCCAGDRRDHQLRRLLGLCEP